MIQEHTTSTTKVHYMIIFIVEPCVRIFKQFIHQQMHIY